MTDYRRAADTHQETDRHGLITRLRSCCWMRALLQWQPAKDKPEEKKRRGRVCGSP